MAATESNKGMKVKVVRYMKLWKSDFRDKVKWPDLLCLLVFAALGWDGCTNQMILEKAFIVIVVICVILWFPVLRLGHNSRVDKSNCQIKENVYNTFTRSEVLMMMTTIAEMMIMIGFIIMVKIAIIVRKRMIKMMMRMMMMIYHQGGSRFQGPWGRDTSTPKTLKTTGTWCKVL